MLQIVWLKGRAAEGRNVKVAVGCPDGVVFYDTPEEWENGITGDQFHNRLLSRHSAALWIEAITMGKIDNDHRKKVGKRSIRDRVDL